MYAAHQDAWEKAHILHRDVSMGNILINVETGTGFLNDWDLCKYKDELDKPASQHVRSVSASSKQRRPEADRGAGNLAVHVCGSP